MAATVNDAADRFQYALSEWARKHLPEGIYPHQVKGVNIHYREGWAHSEMTVDDPSCSVEILFQGAKTDVIDIDRDDDGSNLVFGSLLAELLRIAEGWPDRA